MPHILLAEDDPISAKLTAFILADAGYKVSVVADGRGAVEMAARQHPDLLLLDIQLPALNGFEVCRAIRRDATLPIIFLSGIGSLQDRVRGLSLGADDYIAKPFEATELLARIGAVLRRYNSARHQQLATLSRGALSLDPVRCHAWFEGKSPVELTPIESQVLHMLMTYAGQVVSDQALLHAVWGQHHKGRNLLTVYIYRLRLKLWPDQPDAAPIVTVRGQGYLFTEERVEGMRMMREVGWQ